MSKRRKNFNNLLIQPDIITSNGRVYFTDGTNDNINPNQKQCEAYGYTYNNETGICSAFVPTSSLNNSFANETNRITGAGNKTGSAVNNTRVIGYDNRVVGHSNNNLIVGNGNQLDFQTSNCQVFGTFAEATATNSIVLGGNNLATDTLGERQNITLMYGWQTTDNSTVDAYLNNTSGKYFTVPTNSVVYFQSETVAVRVGGTSGSGAVGDFKSWVERGVVKNAAGTLSIVRSRTSPAASGTTTGWSPINSVSGTNFRQTVKGATNMTIEWASTIRITQIKTGVTLT